MSLELEDSQNAGEIEGLEKVTLKTAQALIELGAFNERLMEDKVWLWPLLPRRIRSKLMRFALRAPAVLAVPTNATGAWAALVRANWGRVRGASLTVFWLLQPLTSCLNALCLSQAFLRVNPHRLRDIMRLSSPESHLDEKCRFCHINFALI
jgi:hypothetical protein